MRLPLGGVMIGQPCASKAKPSTVPRDVEGSTVVTWPAGLVTDKV